MSKELLFSITKKDFKIEYFSGTGKGGQYRNRHRNCVRLRHPESKTIVTGQSHRESRANLKEAFNNMVNSMKFKLWHNQNIQEALRGYSLKEAIKKSMKPENLKIEGRNSEGKWEEL